ncbi:porin family protein [Roseibium denhamense]|nr:porin family protein [Roseibium denhamense]
MEQVLIMLKTFGTAAVAALIPVAAVAADINSINTLDLETQTTNWSGFNAAILAGGGYLRATDSLGLDTDNHSAVFGASVGYDYQIDSFVFGASFEGFYTNFRETTNSGYVHQRARWLGSATVRGGVDVGRFLPYVSVGAGIGTYEVDIDILDTTEKYTDYWFVAGAGVEMKVTDNLFARLDYKHYHFAEREFEVSNFTNFTAQGDTDVVTVGLGYRF